MTKIALPDTYVLGIEDIDAQHGALFDHLHNLDSALHRGDRWVVVNHTLGELLHWTQVHFAVEESVMRICRYPELERHIELHRAFAAEIQRLSQRSLTEDLGVETSRFLNDWLLHHILVEDRKYADRVKLLGERFA